MKKKERVKLQRDIKKFANEFLTTVQNNIKLLNEFDKQESNLFPSIFFYDEVGIECYYSTDRKHIFIIFKKNEKGFSLEFVKGNITDILDKSNAWINSKGAAFRIESSGINLRNCQVKGMKPFEIIGDNIEIQFDDFNVGLPYNQELNLDYGIILSQKKFNIIIEDLLKYSTDVTLSYKNIINIENTNDVVVKGNKIIDIFKVKKDMEHYFFNENVKELEIDKFIYDNPIILEVVFGLIDRKSQVKLVDQIGRFEQDLKPDLIAYNLHTKMWTIVDYKRSNSNLLKKVGKVRESYKSDIPDLIAQLRDYVEFFNDSLNIKYYKDTYGDTIEYPTAIGIIGILPEDYTMGFNRLKRDFPNWVEVRPYNYIYDSFCRFIEVSNSIS